MSRDNIIVKSGWMYKQKTLFQKRWKKKWMILYQDGRISFRDHSSSKKQGKMWDLRRDCMHLWGEKQCRHVLPPTDSTSTCLMELLFVNNKRLTLCCLSEIEAQYWFQAMDRARNERDLTVSAEILYGSMMVPIEEEEESKKRQCACCVCTCSCFSFHNKVREVSYLRPATQGSRRRQKHKRRVSWNDNITMIS